MILTLHTSKGDIGLEMMEKDAPATVANFVKLAKEGFYDGTKFHRVIKDFMIQGGDPQTKDDALIGRWGTGGPGYKFADEIHSNNRNEAGTIAMANAGPNTNGSQFFINVKNNSFLDTKHTVFGKVVQGPDAIQAIENAPTNEMDRPLEAITIKSVTIS
jgi:peptidylprolyl isomerase